MSSFGESLRMDPVIRKRFDKEMRLNPKAKNVSWFWRVQDGELVFDKSADFDSIEDLQDEFPDVEPRFVSMVWEFSRPDGRVQRPLVLLCYAPTRRPLNLNVIYSSAKKHAVALLDVQHTYDLVDAEDLDEDWLRERLERSMR